MGDSQIQLYSLATPNGQKVSVALEEMELDYEPHVINILDGQQFSDDFIKINPNSKIPAIIDPNGPGGRPHPVMESGAILLYLAEKTGLFLNQNPFLRSETIQWLCFEVGGIGPMFGQFGHFYRYAKDKCDHPYPIERYTAETKRLLSVLEKRLENRKFLVAEEYSIVDMATFPWVGCLDWTYEASDFLDLTNYKNTMKWVERCSARPKTKVGLKVCSFDNLKAHEELRNN